MKKEYRIVLIYALLAAVSIAAWFQFSYPRFSILDFSVDRTQALHLAQQYLQDEHQVTVADYATAVVFINDDEADRYLQKALGFRGEQAFTERHQLDLFLWLVRLFKENEQEEFLLTISAATGQVTSFAHIIPDSAARPPADAAAAEKAAIAFLQKTFTFDSADYTVHAQNTQKYDSRSDHAFAWQHKDVYIPWKEGSGGAKLITSVTISGNDILSFSKGHLDIPEQFERYIERQTTVGSNLLTAFTIVYILLLGGATFLVITRKHHLVMHVTKHFFIALGILLLVLKLAGFANNFQSVLFNYETTMTFPSYFWQHATELLFSSFLIVIAIVMPGLAGEALHYEIFFKEKIKTFRHYLMSTFLSRDTGSCIMMGYLGAAIMLGIQATVFHIGQRYWGVWVEQSWITKLSTSYLPFLAAFIVGVKASLVEEVAFRIFAISWGKKVFKSTVVAVVVASVIWGYGHSGYLVFPMWFRGIEVAIMGVFLSVLYLQYGIIPAIVAHYVFDVFWVASGHLLGKSQPFDFYSSLAMVLLPLAIAIVAFIVNRPEKEQPMHWRLNKHQRYNLEVLKVFLKEKGTGDASRQELIMHGWDVAVIDEALKNNSDNS